MPLLKLWNTLRGRSVDEASEPRNPAESSRPAKSASGSDATVDGRRSVTQRDVVSIKSGGARVHSEKGSSQSEKGARRKGVFRAKSHHPALLKAIRGVSATSVLDIAVGDGARAVEVLEALSAAATKKNRAVEPDPIHYIALDQFEMGDGEVTLRQFHQTMRLAGIRPQVFPDATDPGLLKIAHTFGAVDLVILGAENGLAQQPMQLEFLGRILYKDSIVLVQTDDRWERFDGVRAIAVAQSRIAA